MLKGARLTIYHIREQNFKGLSFNHLEKGNRHGLNYLLIDVHCYDDWNVNDPFENTKIVIINIDF